MTESIVMTGLDGANPLAWLAAIGALEVAATHGAAARLSWTGAIGPVLDGVELAQLQRWTLDEASGLVANPPLHYPEAAPADDVKYKPGKVRDVVRVVDRAGGVGAELLAALVAEGSLDGNGRAKPTDLHFTAGQQKFLAMARGLIEFLTEDRIEEALLGPWQYDPASKKAKSFMWDVVDDRDYALSATNPAAGSKPTVPGAEWLALRGLAALPVAARPGRTITPCATGGWKSGAFTWPLWSPAASRDAVRALVRLPVPGAVPDWSVVAARGVDRVYSSAIQRSEQGGYGTFRPPRVLWNRS